MSVNEQVFIYEKENLNTKDFTLFIQEQPVQ